MSVNHCSIFIFFNSFVRTNQVTELKASHASNIWIFYQIFLAKQLLYGVNSFRQKTAGPWMLSLTVLARVASASGTLIDDMAALIAIVANCPLRTFISSMWVRQTVHASVLIGAWKVMMTYLFTSKTAHIALKIPISLFLDFLFFCLLFYLLYLFLVKDSLLCVNNFE